MAIVFAVVCLAQLALSVALLGLRPGGGSTWLLVFQGVLVLAFAGLAVYADRHQRAAARQDLERRRASRRA
jgi:hypothetical protein